MAHRWSAHHGSSALGSAVVAVTALVLSLTGCSHGVANMGDSTSSAPSPSSRGASPAPTPALPATPTATPRPTPTPTASPTDPAPPSMSPAKARADAPVIEDNGCYARHDATAAPDPEACSYGFFDGDTVVLYGDSHAAQWFDAAEEVATRHDWRLLPVTKEACPPGGERVYDENRAGEYTECTTWHDNAMRLIKSQEPILVLVAARSDHYRIVDDGGALSVESSSGRLGLALADDLRAFAEMGARTVLIRDTPDVGFDVPKCIAAGGPDACTYTLAETAPDDAPQLAAAKSTGTTAVDLRSEVCGDRAQCHTVIGGLITFHDAEHLTSTFAGTLADELEAGIEALPA
jgi:hypothetical protein